MRGTRIVRVRESILGENRAEAAALRSELSAARVAMVNVMSSPGSGKTSLILKSIEALRGRYRIGVIEADVDSTVDADKVTAVGIPAVQVQTGGFCHVDAAMVRAALGELPLDELDLLFLENIGNLIGTAQSETGAHVSVAVLSVPEGDDKPIKYPLMFRVVDALVVNKTDYLALAEFSMETVRDRLRLLNPNAPVLPVSCRTGDGLSEWVGWLEGAIAGLVRL